MLFKMGRVRAAFKIRPPTVMKATVMKATVTKATVRKIKALEGHTKMEQQLTPETLYI